MATDKRPTMLRLKNDMYEKLRYLAYIEHRSVNAQIEQAISTYISSYEKKHGAIPIQEPSEEE